MPNRAWKSEVVRCISRFPSLRRVPKHLNNNRLRVKTRPRIRANPRIGIGIEDVLGRHKGDHTATIVMSPPEGGRTFETGGVRRRLDRVEATVQGAAMTGDRQCTALISALLSQLHTMTKPAYLTHAGIHATHQMYKLWYSTEVFLMHSSAGSRMASRGRGSKPRQHG